MMKTRIRAQLFLAVFLALGGSCAAQSNPVNLNGNWRDEKGQSVTIKQSGNQITLTTAAGREFSGTLNGTQLNLQHSLTPAETEQDLPPPVRELATGEIVTIKSTVSADGNEIKGTYTGKKPRWEKTTVNGQDSYNILGWDDVPEESLFNRNGYYISTLSIDYSDWQHKHNELQNALNDAQSKLNIRKSMFADARTALETERTKMQQISAELDAKRAALRAALVKANATTMPASMKTAQYRNIQSQIARLQARQARLEKYFDQLDKGTINGDPQAISNLYDEHDQNAATLTDLQGRLQKLQDQSGFTAQIAAAKTAAQQAEDDYYSALKNDAHERTSFDLAEETAARAQQALDDATNAYNAAAAAFSMFDRGSPLIIGVRVGSYYNVSYWTPETTLEDITKSIDDVHARLLQLDQQRQEDKALFIQYGNSALTAGQILASKQDWTGGSAITQSLVETGFYAYDIGKAWKNGGPAGALFEAMRKGVEAIVIYKAGGGAPITFADPEVSEDDLNAVFEKSRDEMATTVLKSTVKTAAGYGTEIATAAFMKAEEEEALAEASKEIEEVLRSGGTVEAALLRRYQYQEVFRDEAIADFKKAIKDGTFRKMGAKLGSSLVVEVVKDVAKDKMKQAVANYFLGQAFLDYIEADSECRGAALILLKDTARYNAAQDDYIFLQQLKAEILREYDSRNHLKVKRNQTFYDQSGLTIELDNQGYANPAATVVLGGQTASPNGANLHFTVDAHQLQKTADGGVKLDIRVQ